MREQIDHGLTHQELAGIEIGTELHFTNHPCRHSVPVTLLGPRGRCKMPDGSELHCFPDELSREPRSGLGA